MFYPENLIPIYKLILKKWQAYVVTTPVLEVYSKQISVHR